ncbi:hypothetical protein ACSBR1_033209 [Camellia fascicularis]
MESGLHKGPVHFNCFPDFTLNLRDPHILQVLILNIQISGTFTKMLGGAHSIALIYRIYYKCIKTNLNVHALVKSPKDKTVLIQGSTNETNIDVLTTICWNELDVTVNKNYSHPHQSDSNDIQQIQQYDDGCHDPNLIPKGSASQQDNKNKIILKFM